MKNNLKRTILALWCGLIGLCNSVTAAPHNGDTDSTRAAVHTPMETPATLRSFPELEQYLKNNHLYEPTLLHQGYAAPEFTADYIEKNFLVSTVIADRRGEAQAAMDELARKTTYIDNITPNDLVDLPVGMKKKLGTSTVIVAVSKAKFYPSYTELTIFCKIDLPQGKSILFGANNVKLSQSGGLIGDANLVLLGDYQIPINGGNTMITLKGGMDFTTGNATNLTYAKLTCGGVQEVEILADISFPRSLLTPLNADYTVTTNPSLKVTGTFQTKVTDWNDILTSITLPPFALKGLDKVAFQLQNAVIDLSDTRNFKDDPNVPIFPQGYGNLVQGNENLWRGVFIRKVTVVLPKEFKKKGTTERVTFMGEKLLIDNWGFTGLVSASNIMQNGTATGWDFSVDKFSIEVQSNRLRSAGFEGAIALPVSKRTPSGNVKDYGLPYQAIFSADNGYLMSVGVKDTLKFDVWKAKAKLLPGSYIDLVVKNDKFRPKAFLNGNIDVNTTDDVNKKEAEFKGVVFQGLQMQTEAPYLQAQYFGYQSQSKMANFPITINQLGLSTNPSNNEVSLIAGVQLNLMEESENKISASTVIRVVGVMMPSEESFTYDYRRLELDQIKVNAVFKDAFSIDGFVNFFRDHPIMGNGFSGGLDVKLLDGTGKSILAKAAFGNKDYRYWYVDMLAGGLNLNVAGGLFITSLGGGASYHMKKNVVSVDQTICPSGIGYDPDNTTGLGLRLMALYKVGSKNVATGKAALDMMFTTSGGLARISFNGDATIMPSGTVKSETMNIGTSLNKVKSKLTSLTSNINQNSAGYKYLLEHGQFADAANQFTNTNDDKTAAQGSIDATVGIEYDFQSKVLDGNFAVYVNLANGMVRGIDANDLAGWAKMRFTPSKWYIHMGTPQNPLGVHMAIGVATVRTGTYFMVGDSLGASPAPPAEVANLLGTKLQSLDYMRNLNDLGTGRGLAFGSKISLNTGQMNWLLFYAQFQAGIGFDIMVKDYGDTKCVGYADPIGMNGWYANGQAYAYLQGQMGIHVKLAFIRKDIPIINAGAAVLLQTKLPKPTWFSGQLAGTYNLLGGLVKGGFSCKVNFGDNCVLDNNGAATTSQFDYITDFVPSNNEEEVDVLGVPQAVFRLPIENPFMGEVDDNGNATYYGAKLDQFTITKDGVQIAGQLKWNSGKETVFFESNEILPPNALLKAFVKVSFYKVTGGYWQPLYQYEQKEISFKTGTAPSGIPLSNIAYAYPTVGQKYFLTREHNQGFIKLKRGQSYLLNSGSVIKTKFTATDGTVVLANSAYNVDSRLITFTMPTLSNSQTYNLEIVSEQQIAYQMDYTQVAVSATNEELQSAEGSSVSVASNVSSGMVTRVAPGSKLLTYGFATSEYGTFVQKMQAKGDGYYHYTEDIGLGYLGQSLLKQVNWTEPFDITDLKGTKYTDLKPLINPEATLTDNYFNASINPIIYSWIGNEGFTLNRETPNLGTPPSKAIQVSSSYIAALEGTSTDWWAGMVLYYQFPYQYKLVKYYNEDYAQLQSAVIERYGTIQQYCYWVEDYWSWWGGGYEQCDTVRPYPYYTTDIVEGSFPVMPNGNYGAKLRYKLPNGVETSSYDTNYNYSSGY